MAFSGVGPLRPLRRCEGPGKMTNEMVKLRSSQDAARQTETPRCSFDGCAGCYMCIPPLSPLTQTSQARITNEIPSLTRKVSPLKSYAEAVTGSPHGTPPHTGDSSTGPTRGHGSDDVTPDSSVLCDALSIQVRNDINEEVLNEPTQRSIPTITEPFNNVNKKQKWTIEDKVELYRCYCEATSKELKATAGTYSIWREKYPTDRPNMNAMKLSNQRRIVEKFLTQSEKENIKREFTQQETREHNVIDGEVLETNPDMTNMLQNNVEEELEDTNKVVFSVEELKMKDELTVMFTKVKNEELDQRIRPNKFPMHGENRKKLESMNKILTIFIEEETHIGIDELNALHYSSAVILAGLQKTFKTSPQMEKTDPDGMIKKRSNTLGNGLVG